MSVDSSFLCKVLFDYFFAITLPAGLPKIRMCTSGWPDYGQAYANTESIHPDCNVTVNITLKLACFSEVTSTRFSNKKETVMF